MGFDTTTHGYAFTRELCHAIELYSAAEVSKNPAAFNYRGLNLRYAVERQLYISCINSAALFEFYRRGLPDVGAYSEAALALSPMDRCIARFMPGGPARLGKAPRQRGLAYLLLRWLRAWAIDLILRLASSHQRPRVDILFHVVHPKFARYLAPLAARLAQGSHAYLVSGDADLATAIAALGEPTVVRPRSVGPLRAQFSSGPLREFLGLRDAADAALAAVRFVAPACMVVAEGNAPLDSITAEVCRALGIPCFCVQQGWSPYVHTGFRNMSFTSMFVWGERFAEMLAPFNPAQRFLPTGSHALAGARIGLPVRRTVSFFLQAPCAFLGSDAYDSFVGLIVRCAQEHPAANFVVREHPSYPVPGALRTSLQARPNLRFSDPARDSLADLICESELVVSVFSSVLLESLVFGVVPLICSIGALPNYVPDIAGAGVEVHSIEAARAFIGRVLDEPTFLAPYRAAIPMVATRYFSVGDAVDTMARELAQACAAKMKPA